MLRALLNEPFAWLAALVFAIPGKSGQLCRSIWCRTTFGSFGSHSRISGKSAIFGASAIYMGENVSFGRHAFLNAEGGSIDVGNNVKFNENVQLNASVGGSISIKNNCLIGPNVVLRTASHRFDDRNTLISKQGHNIGDIVIEEDVWLAANVIILPNVTIGKGSVIGAGAVVTKSVPDDSVCVGVPAKVIGRRGQSD